MKTDRELLEAAAKVLGLRILRWHTMYAPGPHQIDFAVMENGRFWNPLADNGNALELAVQLRLDVHFELNGTGIETQIVEVMDAAKYMYEGSTFCAMQDCSVDPCAATRRAIVRAAAEMAK